MVQHQTNYLRLHRRKRGLTQEELAYLLGYQSGAKISRLEQAESAQVLSLGFTFELLFGVDAREIYPALYDAVRQTVSQRLRELGIRLQATRPTQKTIIKRRLLKEALARAENPITEPRV